MTGFTHNVWLHRFCWLVGLATLFLVALGGVVTTKGVGMAVPDWPTTYGQNMFLFPYSKWVGGIFYEHSHRLVASGVGLLTTVLAVWLWIKERRPLLRWLGLIAFFAVVLQGVLGGMRVVFDSHGWGTELGIFHATLAQLFFLLIGTIVLLTSRWWSGGERARANPSPRVRALLLGTTLLVLLQLVLGATMRHQHAGLAVPDFPLAYGKVWPSIDSASVAAYNAQRLEAAGEEPITGAHIVVHMLHRFTGLTLGLCIAACAIAACRTPRVPSLARKLSLVWVLLAAVQIALGAFTVWSQRKVDVTTAHVAVGALTFLMGWLAYLASGRTELARVRQPAGAALLSPQGELKHA